MTGTTGLLTLAALSVAALVLRLAGLGQSTLTPDEGVRALAAWQLTQGGPPEWWDAPAFVLVEAAGLFLFGDAEASARLLPAVLGGGCVASLILFRSWLGWWPVVLAMGLLAVSPSGLLLSRSVAEDTAAALLTLLLGWGLVRYWEGRAQRFPVLGGIGVGVLFHLGFAGITGAMALLVFSVVHASLRGRRSGAPAWLRQGWAPFLIPLSAAFILVGTGSLFHLAGFGFPSLTAWAGHLDAGAGGSQAWLALVGYEAVAFFVGVPAAALALLRWPKAPDCEEEAATGFLAVWAVLALGLLLLERQGAPASVFAAALPLTVLTGKLLGDQVAGAERDTVVRFLSGRPAPVLALIAFSIATVLQVHGTAKLSVPWMGTVSSDELLTGEVRGLTRLAPYTASGRTLTAAVQQDLKPVLGWYLRDVPAVAYVTQVRQGPTLLVGEPPSDGSLAGYSRRDLPAYDSWRTADWGLRDAVHWLLTATVPDQSRTSRRVAVMVRT